MDEEQEGSERRAMNLDRVTVTGADDSVSPSALAELSAEFPFVEWGVLASASQTGGKRFPSLAWMEDLRKLAHSPPVKLPYNMQLSLHLCGRWVRRLLLGQIDPVIKTLLGRFQRVQLNFHAEENECRVANFADALMYLGNYQYIFQIDGARGNDHLASIWKFFTGISAVPLFDLSGGAGILPTEWPRPVKMPSQEMYHGYAGGLGPDNLAEQLPKIAAAAGDCRIWIDAETKLRSDDDRQFDLAKVRRFLEIAKPFVKAV